MPAQAGQDSGADNGQLGAVQMALANMPTNAPTVPSPFRLSRRAVLTASALAAGLVVGGGALAWYKLHNPTGTQQTGNTVTPTTIVETGPKNLVAGTPILQLTAHTNYVWVAAWDPTGRYLLTAGKDGNIFIWDITAAVKNAATTPKLTQPLHQFTVADLIFDNVNDQICWSQDGKKLIVVGITASATTVSKIYVLDPFTPGSNPVSYSDYDDVIMGNNPIYGTVSAGPGSEDFTVLNVGSTGSQAQVWSVGQTEVPAVIYDAGDDLSRTCWSADGSLLAGMTSDVAAKLALLLWQKTNPRHPQEWNLPTRDSTLTFFREADTLSWSPVDNHYLLISNVDQMLIWDRRVNKAVLTLQANTTSNAPVITGASWSPNGRYVTTSYSPDGSQVTQVTFTNPQIMVWDVQKLLKASNSDQAQLPLLTFKSQVSSMQHKDAITDLNWSPDGRYLATASFDKSVIIWKVDS
jgi:WD40 repeat protein